MRYLDATPRDINPKLLQRRSAQEADCDTLITEDCVVNVEGQPKIVYLSRLSHPDVERARAAVQRVKYQTSTRTSGLVSTSRIFGYAPRNVLRGHPCRSTSMATEHPEEHAAICEAAPAVDAQYQRFFPTVHDQHRDAATRVREQWMIPGSVFTSGIVNYNNPLQYHFDAGNFSQVCSAMIGFRHKTQGGHLACPELGLAFEIGDRSLILFDGQKLLHGVTPIKRLAEDAFRFTIVYYSLKQMWNCETVKGEVDALRTRRTATERRRATGAMKGGAGDA
jgi:hypothetical protein